MTRTLVIAARVIAALGGLLLLDAAALAQPPQPTPPGPPCLRQGQIYDFKPVVGNRSLIVTDVRRQRYRLSFMGICYNLQFHLGLGFKSFGAGTLSCLSNGDSVIMRDAPNRCIIKDIQYQTPALDQADAAAAAAAKLR